MLKNKKNKLYKREKINLFLKNPFISSFTFCKNSYKDNLKKDINTETHYYDNLKEKRKLKILYGISDKKYNNYYNISKNIKYNTSDYILRILESRFDNIIYRAGFSCTRREAKQMISHGYFKINESVVKYPSRFINIGDYISLNFLKKNFYRKEYFYFYFYNLFYPDWIFVNKNKVSLYIKRYPNVSELKCYISDINKSFLLSNL